MIRAFLLALVVPGAALAQGFAGLGTDAEGFALPRREPFEFPRDHGPHPGFRIEWWYVTANLRGADGRDYGIQWTLFRSALAPEEGEGWQSPQLWAGHAALTTPDAHFVAERLARGGIGQAGVEAEPFAAWIDEWSLAGPTLAQVALHAAGRDFAYTLSLTADRPFVPQGEDGYSVKSADGQASRYYSQPFYAVAGELRLPDGPVAVTGQAWLDREWSSQPLSEDQSGWDWASLHLDDGSKLMGFRVRSATRPPFTTATWIAADGTPTAFGDGALEAEPLETAQVAGRAVPVRWRLRLEAGGIDVEIAAINPQAWMTTTPSYWEGPVRVSGSHPGVGYLEMTGYE